MFENPRSGRQARNFTTNVPKILVLKTSSEQIFSRKLPLGAPGLSDRVRLLKKCVGGKIRSVRGKKLACHNPFDTPDRLGIPALEYDEER